MQTNPSVGQNETLDGPRVRGISPVGTERSMEERISRRAKS